MRRVISSIVLVLGLLAAPAVHACSCLEPPPFEQAFAASAAVFKGVVESIEPVQPETPYYIRVTLRTTGVWKGNPGAYAVVWTGVSSASCGLDFAVGQEWLIYGSAWDPANPGEYGAFLCGRTWFAENHPDLALLGPTPVDAGSWGRLKALYR